MSNGYLDDQQRALDDLWKYVFGGPGVPKGLSERMNAMEKAHSDHLLMASELRLDQAKKYRNLWIGIAIVASLINPFINHFFSAWWPK